MPHALPILFQTGPSDDASGSAFLFTHEERLWLCTAAHVPLYGQMQAHGGRWMPHKNWQTWPQTMIVLTPPTPTSGPSMLAGLPMFANGAPLFRYLDVDDTHIADLLVLPLDAQQQLALAPFTRFVLGADRPRPGTAVEALGYPRVRTANGPHILPLHQEAATVTAIPGELVQHDYQALEGMSGGPLVSVSGNLIGMNIGHEDGSGFAVGQSAIARAICEQPGGEFGDT